MISWIRRNERGNIRAFCAVEYADPNILDEFLEEDGMVELVEANQIILNSPLPPGSRVLITKKRNTRS